MVRLSEIRLNEVAVDVAEPDDARLSFIGTIRTPWTSRMQTPRQGRHDGPVCIIEIFEPWVPALKGVEAFERLEILYVRETLSMIAHFGDYGGITVAKLRAVLDKFA